MAQPRNPSGEKPWPAERPAEPEIDRDDVSDVDRDDDKEDIVGFGDDDDDDVDPDSADSENDRDDTIDDV
jgi:hypothetical protein